MRQEIWDEYLSCNPHAKDFFNELERIDKDSTETKVTADDAKQPAPQPTET